MKLLRLFIILLIAGSCSSQRILNPVDLENSFNNSGISITSIASNEHVTLIGTHEGLYILKNKSGKLSHMTTDNSILPSNYISSVVCMKDGNLYVGTSNGILRFDIVSTSLVINSENSKLPDNRITALAEDADGNLWIGTHNGGIAKVKNGIWKIYNIQNSKLENNSIFSISADTNGNVWVATLLQGIVRIKDGNWKVYNAKNSDLNAVNISFVIPACDNNYFIGTYDEGIFKFDGQNFIKLNNCNVNNRKFRFLNHLNGTEYSALGLEDEVLILTDNNYPFENKINCLIPRQGLHKVNLKQSEKDRKYSINYQY